MVAMEKLFSWHNWPVLVVCLAMVAAAVIDWWKFKVPNWLTFPIVFSGWALGILYDTGALTLPTEAGIDPAGSRIVASLVCTFWGCILLYWLYMIGGVGAGDV